MSSSLLCFLVLVLILTAKATADVAADRENNNHVKSIIGAIVDNSSRIGKEQTIAMQMAVEDFNGSSNQSLLLHIRNSRREPVHAALTAMDLINEQEVQAILGPQTWDETCSVVKIASNKHIPVLSFAEAAPTWATERWSFLLQASPNQQAQMKAIAAIVQSWEWHEVTVIYEDTDSSATGVIPHLSDALREVGAAVIHALAIPPFPSSRITKELEKLKSGQCRVFVVNLSLESAVNLLKRAKEMKMTEKDYIWITTNAFTSLVHSINPSNITSIQGIVGVRNFFPRNKPLFQDFYRRFRKRFGSEYPEEYNHDPGASAVQAYEAVWSVALAMRKSNKLDNQKLLRSILRSDFDGLTGKVHFINQKVAPANIYEIINLIGKTYRKLGYWTHGLGFSNSIDENATYNFSMKDLGKVCWPGTALYTPRGWTLPTSAKPLKIGVPMRAQFKEYVRVVHVEQTNVTYFEGFSIELFRVTIDQLPFHLPYTFIPFNGSYDDLVKQIYLKNFDAVVGNVAIVAKRYQYAEFTPPYTESELVMIVPVRNSSNKTLLFLKPFTKAMWILILVVSIYNGFIVWLIERKHWPELNGSALHQTGMFLWLSFNSLFSVHGEKLHSNLSRMTMVVWLFVALVISQTYTANLTSMLTVQGLKPTVDNVEWLKINNAIVGYPNQSYYPSYLKEVLGFNSRNLKGFTSLEDCARDLRNGKTAAIFLGFSLAKIFLARYCRSFTLAGPSYKIGGMGFAFAKGSPLLPIVTEALLNVSENGKVGELEKKMIASEKCMEVNLPEKVSTLGADSFWVLFVLTSGTSTIALVAYLTYLGYRSWKINEYLRLHETIRTLIFALSSQLGRRQSSSVVELAM